MKTIKSLFLVATLVLSSYCFSQETVNENTSHYLLSYNHNLKEIAEMPAVMQRRAAFNPSSSYKSLQEFLNLNIEFPEDAKSIGASGNVIAQFEILWDGSLGEIYFVKSPDQLFSNEVERVLRKAPLFIPAIKEGVISSSYEQVKISFTLE